MRKIVITGVAGFIGTRLAQALLAQPDVLVTGIDAITDYYAPSIKRERIEQLRHPRFEFVEGNINMLPLADVIDGATTIYHQAGQPGVRKSWGSEFGTYLGDNVAATQAILDAVARCSGIQRVVYASSSSVYGNAERLPTSESDLPQPVSPYGVTKLAAEHLCSLYAATHGVPTVSLRYFTVYGPGQRPDMAFSRFIHAGLEGSSIQVFGDGSQVRDFTYVDDIVAANLAAASAPDVAPGSVFNISGGAMVPLREALRLISHELNADLRIQYEDAAVGDARSTGGDSTSARRVLGWTPQVSLEEGIRRQVHAARSAFVSS